MKELLAQFESRVPEIVVEWQDSETEARGWLVINSLHGGAAGGGTRMRKGCTRDEVISLAKTMEVKFRVAGPDIGGAKSGIDFDPSDPRKKGVLRRWFRAISPYLGTCYGTGGDLNVDEIKEVIPFTEELGIHHPQEGIVNGHFKGSSIETVDRLARLRQGVSRVISTASLTPDLNAEYTVADLITGYGVAESVVAYYNLWGGSIKGKRVLLQGWGNVGAAAAFYLAGMEAKIVGIMDKNGYIVNTDGFSFSRLVSLITSRTTNEIPEAVRDHDDAFWKTGAEVFIPAAASRLVTLDQVKALLENGLEVVSCGANVPFDEPSIFYGEVSEYLDSSAALIPPFVANCGMARTFAHLMEKGSDTDEKIFSDVQNRIGQALAEIHRQHPARTGLSARFLEVALKSVLSSEKALSE